MSNTSILSSAGRPIRAVAGYGDAFVSVFRTTTASEDVSMPTHFSGTYACDVDWGDGSIDIGLSGHDDARWIHNYAVAGDYTISITGTCTTIQSFNHAGRTKFIKVLNLGKTGWTSLRNMLNGASNFNEFVAGTTDTINLTNMDSAFKIGTSVATFNLHNMDVTNVTTMDKMFEFASGTTEILLDAFNTPNVTVLNRAFYSVNTDVDISSIEVASLIDATGMMQNSLFSDANYDKMLLAWSVQTMLLNVTFHAGTAKYTETAARQILVNAGWIITDGGPA